MNRFAAPWSSKGVLASAAVLAACCGLMAGGAQAAGKPDKAFLESQFHLLIVALRKPELHSRVTGNQLYSEHPRDVRVAPGLLRYAQSVPLPLYDLRSSFDSISELNYPDFEKARVAFASDEVMLGDMPWMLRFAGGFTDGIRPWRPKGSGMTIVRDHVIVDGHEWGYKWFNFMRRKEGISKEQADAYMRDQYAPALAKLPGIRRYVVGLTYTPKEAVAAGGVWALPQYWDAIDMIWFDDLEAMMRLLGSVEYQEVIQRPAEAAVIDQSASVSFAAEYHERVPFPPRYRGPSWEEMKPASAISGAKQK